ncbi:type II secretion system protein [bacterium]|nr:type II secretion system protein [bacterium]
MRKALTIGELLITMAIIGTISALVLPGVIKDYHKRVYVTKLKKVVEMLDSAINQACSDNNVSYFYQTPYAAAYNSGGASQAFIDKYFKKASGDNSRPFASKYGIINSSSTGSFSLANDRHGYAKLASGEAVSFFCWANSDTNSRYCRFRVDINSTEGPNIGGRDLFSIYIDKYTNKIFDNDPVTECGKEYIDTEDENKTKTKYNFEGKGCFAQLLENNWEMKY